MNSLKWRITIVYSLLIAFAIAAIGIVIVLRFQTILYEQAQQRVNRVMSTVLAAANSESPFTVQDPTQAPYERIITSGNISMWDSPTTFIQIDTPEGALLNKSAYLGEMRFPPNRALKLVPKAPIYRVVDLPSGPFLVEDEYLRLNAQQAVIVHVGEELNALYRTFEQTRQAIVLIIGIALTSVIVLSVLLASQITEPINNLARTMRELRADTLNPGISGADQTGRRDEIGLLASSFNELVERLGEAFARERQFISDASHELKTPLTSINANAQMLLRWGDSDEAIRKESLETIARESGELAGMVSGMLTLAKADRGDTIPKERLSLYAVASEAVHAAAQRAAAKGLDFHLEPPPAGADILGDHGLIKQLIGNLIDNAIKFTEHGAVRLRVGSNVREAWVEVRDTGLGIPTEELPRIFERFYRADKARSRSVPGTGLGLAIVRSIARVHGGRVEAHQAPGGGTIFTATFPALTQSS